MKSALKEGPRVAESVSPTDVAANGAPVVANTVKIEATALTTKSGLVVYLDGKPPESQEPVAEASSPEDAYFETREGQVVLDRLGRIGSSGLLIGDLDLYEMADEVGHDFQPPHIQYH